MHPFKTELQLLVTYQGSKDRYETYFKYKLFLTKYENANSQVVLNNFPMQISQFWQISQIFPQQRPVIGSFLAIIKTKNSSRV